MLPSGVIKSFKVEPFIEAAEILCQADEMERALNLLNGLPGYYRDNEPPEVTSMREDIYKALMNPSDYSSNPNDQHFSTQRALYMLESTDRGISLQREVQELNGKGLIPHIVDYGPGEFWVPMGLTIKKCRFTYQPIGLPNKIELRVQKFIGEENWNAYGKYGEQPCILFACEIVEHLWNPYELFQAYVRCPVKPATIYISTPRYCCGNGNAAWRLPENHGMLGHLRTYTPSEFKHLISTMFKEAPYSWVLEDGIIITMKGVLNPTPESSNPE